MKSVLAAVAVLALSACAGNQDFGPGLIAYHDDSAWLEDAESGCKVNRYYIPDAVSVGWTGKCIDGFAIGEGQLTWVEDSGIEGFHQTCLQPDHPYSACKMGGGGHG